MMRRLYDWILDLAGRPNALYFLALLSFAESMIFPIPPDVMLVPMCVAKPDRALLYALWCSIASVLGGVAGYALGMFFWDAVGPFFFDVVPGFTQEKFDLVGGYYQTWNFWIVFAAGFTPIPYKIITITAGVFGINFPIFVVASAVSRSARFFIEAVLLKKYGTKAQEFIDKRFNLVAMAFVVLLVGGFVAVSQLGH